MPCKNNFNAYIHRTDDPKVVLIILENIRLSGKMISNAALFPEEMKQVDKCIQQLKNEGVLDAL